MRQKISRKAWIWTILAAILLFSAFFRVLHLNNESLWLDEGITIYNSSGPELSAVWDRVTALDQSPPGYYLLMHEIRDIFGSSERVLRLVSVVFGILSVLVLYLLMAEIFNREIGLIAAFLLALHPFHIGFSMEARMYVLLSLISLIGFWSLWKALQGSGKEMKIFWVLFALSSAAGVYTHYFYLFVLLAFLAIFSLILPSVKSAGRKFAWGLGAAIFVVVAYLPWLDSMIYQVFSTDRFWISPEIGWDMITDYLLHFANWDLDLLWLIIALSFAAVAYAVTQFFMRKWNSKQLLGFLSLEVFIVVALGIPMALSIYNEPIIKLRYMVYIVPILMGIVALGLEFLRKVSIALFVAILFVYLSLVQPWLHSNYPLEFGEDFRALTEKIQADPAAVVIHTPSMAHMIRYYSDNQLEVRPYPNSDDLRNYSVIENEETKADYQNYISDLDKFWLVVGHSHEKPGGLFEIWSDELCEGMEEIEESGLRVWKMSGC